MSECEFNFQFSGTAESLVDQISTKVSAAGGVFDRSDTDGCFFLPTAVGEFKGTFQIDGNIIWLRVTQKPFLISCNVIQSKLSELIQTHS